MKRSMRIGIPIVLLMILSACNPAAKQAAMTPQIDAPLNGVVTALGDHPQSAQKLNSDDVASLQVIGGLPGTANSPLYLKNDPVVARMIGWINAATPVDGQTEYGKHGYPKTIRITMENGELVEIEPAYNCVTRSDPDGGSTKTCTPVEGQVVLQQNSGKTLLSAPELSDWLKEGWKLELQDG